MTFDEKILNFVKKDDPREWWREYPPKFVYRGKIIPHKKIKEYLEKVFSAKEQKIGVYINIPFCRSRCRFCKFYSEIPKNQNEIDDYLDCLERELELYGINFKKTSLDTLYIGGGTPTLLGEDQWKRLFKIIHKFFDFKKDVQILTEGTPETSTLPKLKLLKKLGVNRFTIGAQSFDDAVLKGAGRLHREKDIYQGIKNARRAGIRYINLDILLGLVGETWDSYTQTLKGIVDLKPDCVSFMTLDFGRQLNSCYEAKARKAYFLKQSLKPKIFSYLGYILERTGYEKVEGFSDSTFISKGRDEAVNRHLLNRQKFNSVLGLGPKANSHFGPLKYCNTADNRQYRADIKKGELPVFTGEELGKEDYMRRYLIYMFVFWKKVNKKDFQRKFGEEIEKVIDKKFVGLKKDGKLFDAGDDLIFLPSSEIIRGIGKYFGKNYGNQERSFLFCLKYFYSPRIINRCKKYLKYYENNKNKL